MNGIILKSAVIVCQIHILFTCTFRAQNSFFFFVRVHIPSCIFSLSFSDALAELSGKPNQPSTTPNLRADAQYSAAVLSTRSSTLSMFPAQAAGAGLGPLVPPSATLPSASKRSPKLWPKRSANLVSHSTPAMPTTDWVEYSSGPVEDFRTLHEDFGKEVKKLITEWARRKGLNIHVNEDLINFG